MKTIIVVAGATGNLGERIINSLLSKGAEVHAIVRKGTEPQKLTRLEKPGVKVFQADMSNGEEVKNACVGASCVVSALAGLREVIIDTQQVLLEAAVAAGVPRFIPSDYSLDFTKFPGGKNRNLDLRREFHLILDKSPIKATTIFNGAFTELLTGDMPLILFKFKRILYWGSPDQRMDFTTMDNTAEFTANAALDSTTPRFLRIAGDQISAREMKGVLTEITSQRYQLFRPGGLALLGIIIKIARKMSPGETELYPAWQGMQYMRNMMSGEGTLVQLDNKRYPDIHWTTAQEMLTQKENATIVGLRV